MKTHGEVIQHASFDSVLWTEMILKMMLDYPDMPTKRPALNWGVQFHSLKLIEPGMKDKLMREHLEVVYPGAVYDGLGLRVPNPKHAVVPELLGNIKCRIDISEDSGLIGFLERFLPPFTSQDLKQETSRLLRSVHSWGSIITSLWLITWEDALD